MASFDLLWRASTKKDLRGIPRDDVARIMLQKTFDSDEVRTSPANVLRAD